MNTEREEGEIYSDLADVDLGAEIAKLREKEQALIKHVHKLQSDVAKLCGKVTELYGDRENLSLNISELFKTARLEISRKDRRIEELQKQLDDVLFRRNFQRPKRMRDEGNPEFNEAKRSKEDVGPRSAEENFNRFPNRKRNFNRWRNPQNQGRFKEETASGSEEFGRKNFHNQERNEGRSSPNVGGEGRFNRNNSPSNWKNQGRIKEEGYNKSRTPHSWRNTQNQRRNSPSVEVETKMTREATPVDGEENWDIQDNCNRNNPWSMEVDAKEKEEHNRNMGGEENCSNSNRNNTLHSLKNVYNQDRSSPNTEVEPKKIKEERTAHRNMESEENCNVQDKYNRSNTANHPWKNVHNQGRNSPNIETEAKKIKEERTAHRNVQSEENRNVEDNFSNKYNRSNSANHPWKNVQNQGRNSPNIETEAKKIKEERTAHRNVETEENRNVEDSYSNKYNRSNSAHVHNQGRNSPNTDVEPKKVKEERTAHRNIESQENCNVEDNYSNKCNRSNTANHPWKNVHNQGRNSPNIETEAKKIKEERTSHRNVETEENRNVEDTHSNKYSNSAHHPWKNVHNQESEAKKIKEEISAHSNPGDENFKRNTSPDFRKNTPHQSSNVYKDRQQFGKDRSRPQENEQHRRDEEVQQKQKVEKCRDDERHKKEDSRHKQSESLRSSRDERPRKIVNRSDRGSRSKDRHDGKRRSKSRDRHRTYKRNDDRKLSTQDEIIDLDDLTEELQHKEKPDHKKSGAVKETLLEEMKKLDEMTSVINDRQQFQTIENEAKHNTNLNMEILRADLNISNDSTGLPVNTSDLGTNSEVIHNSTSANESVDKNLTTSFNSSNVSDDLTKKVTPTTRRRRCVMSFKN